jgi:hypothetical protein
MSKILFNKNLSKCLSNNVQTINIDKRFNLEKGSRDISGDKNYYLTTQYDENIVMDIKPISHSESINNISAISLEFLFENPYQNIDIASSVLETDDFVENKINEQQRLNDFNAKYTPLFLKCLKDQDFEYGFTSLADKLFEECINADNLIAKKWLNNLFIKYYSEKYVLVGILQVLAHIDYEKIVPEGPTMALAALSNINAEVRECGIRAIESWGNIESIGLLENTKCPERWLDEYRIQVIEDLKLELI